MLELLGSGILGVVTGFIGNIVTSITNYKTQKLKNEHEIQKIKALSKAAKVEAEANIKVTRAETEGEIEVAEIGAFMASIQQDKNPLFDSEYMKILAGSKWLSWAVPILALVFGFTDAMKKAARPVYTTYLLILSTYITYLCWTVVQAAGGIPADRAIDLFWMVVYTIIYMTTTALGWWYADRRVAKFMMRLADGNLKK